MKKTILQKVHDFNTSSYSMIFFVLTILFFSIIQISLFATGITTVNGKHCYDNGSLFIWITFFFSITSSITGLIGGIYANRGDDNFLYWIIYADFSCAISVYISGAIILSIITIIMLFLLFARKFMWKIIEEKEDYSSKKPFILIVSFFLVAIVFVTLIIFFFGDNIYKENINTSWVRYCDGIQSILVLTASLLIIFKIRCAFIFYLLSCAFTMAFFASSNVNQIVPVIQQILFSMMYLTGFLSWEYIKK